MVREGRSDGHVDRDWRHGGISAGRYLGDVEFRIELAARLKNAIQAAGVAITDVSIGDEAIRSTWRVHPASLQAAAQPTIDAYTDPTPNTLLDHFADQRIGEKALMAVAQALWECIPAPTMTKAQLKARAKAIFKTL